jgi:hypothetical protein
MGKAKKKRVNLGYPNLAWTLDLIYVFLTAWMGVIFLEFLVTKSFLLENNVIGKYWNMIFI